MRVRMKGIKWKRIKNVRRRAVKYFFVFLLFMLLCTVVSRGIYAYQMPRVEIGQAAQKSISHTISAIGNVETKREVAVVIEEGIRIREICVKAGEEVEKGTVLFRLDILDLKDLIEGLNKKIGIEKEKITALKANSYTEEQAVKNTWQRAKEDFLNTTQIQNKKVSNAQKAYNTAVNKLSSYPSWEVYLMEEKKKDSQYQTLKSEAEKETALKKEKEEFSLYEDALKLSARSTWEEGKKVLEEDVSANQSNLSTIKEEKKAAILEAKRNMEDAKKNTPIDKSGIMEEEDILLQMEKQLADYQELLKNKGRIVSDINGYVSNICITAGDRTTDSAALLLADGSKGWSFRAMLTEEQTEYIKVGDMVTLQFQNGKVKEENCQVEAINKTKEEETYEAIVKFTEINVSLGETGVLEVTNQTDPYSCCIPLSALYSDNQKDYILLIRETDTIMGTELSVVKKEVIIQDKNESEAALEDNSLGEDDRFVVYASKAVAPGDKVRLLEEDDERK